MVEIACEGEPLFQASDVESGEQTNYSIRTVRKILAALDPGDELFFLIGADAFAEIESWFEWRELLGLVCFIVVSRPGHEYEVPEEAQALALDGVQIPVSSSDIRREVGAGASPAELPPGVLSYIREKKLYLGASS
jgi:nicotinate-nucleotide adenylyltransferase